LGGFGMPKNKRMSENEVLMVKAEEEINIPEIINSYYKIEKIINKIREDACVQNFDPEIRTSNKSS
jgi:hypothetical protein